MAGRLRMLGHTFSCTVHAYKTWGWDNMLEGIGCNNTMDIHTLFQLDSSMLTWYLSSHMECWMEYPSLWLCFPSISNYFSLYSDFIRLLIFIFAIISSPLLILLFFLSPDFPIYYSMPFHQLLYQLSLPMTYLHTPIFFFSFLFIGTFL